MNRFGSANSRRFGSTRGSSVVVVPAGAPVGRRMRPSGKPACVTSSWETLLYVEAPRASRPLVVTLYDASTASATASSTPITVTWRKRQSTEAWRARFMSPRLGRGRRAPPSPWFRPADTRRTYASAVPRVLLIARYFPPIGGAGVHPTGGAVGHPPADGYEPLAG